MNFENQSWERTIVRDDSAWTNTDAVQLAGVAIIVVLATYGIGHYIFQNFPNSADEHAYLFQAQLFSQGRFYSEAHPKQEFFSPFYILTHNNNVFSLFPPGWPLVLSLGLRWGGAEWINPIIGGLTIFVLFAIGWMIGGRRYAWMSVGLLILSPFFLLNSASYFSHPACLMGVLLTIWFFMLWDRYEFAIYAVLAGIAASWAFSIREYTAFLLLIVSGMSVIRHSIEKKLFLGGFLTGFLPGFILYLFNNQVITGNWWKPPRFLQSSEWLGFGEREIRVFDYVEIQQFGILDGLFFLFQNMGRLFDWTFPGLPLLALWGAWYFRRERWLYCFALSSALLPIGYLFYPSGGGNQYGPRFYYESLGFLVLLAVPACLFFFRNTLRQRIVTWVLFLLLATDAALLGYHGYFHAQQIYARRTVYRLVEHRDIHQALVFVAAPSGDMTQGDLIRNPPDLAGADVIYAWHLGKRNQELKTWFPKRAFYLFGRDARTGLFFLERLSL